MRICLLVMDLAGLMPTYRYGFQKGGPEVWQWNLVGPRMNSVRSTS